MNIVILSRNRRLYSTNRLVEAAKERGHNVQVIDHTKCHMVIEKGNIGIFHGEDEIENIDAIIPRIGASVTFYGSSVIRQFEAKKVFTTVSSLALVRSRDKLRSHQVLAKAGVNIPRTAFAKHPDDTNNLLKQVGGAPLVIKLLEGTQGLGVVLAETRKAAKSVIEAFYNLNANILIQEFIEEAKGADVRAFVVDGNVVGAIKRQGVEGEFRSNLHRGGKAHPIKLTKAEQAMAVKAAKALGLGIAGVDMLQSNKGPLILEVNSSPGLEGIEKATEIDIAGMIIEYVEKQSAMPTERKKDKVGI